MQGAAVQRTLPLINIYRPLVLFIITFSWIKENMIIALMTNRENSKYINPSKVLQWMIRKSNFLASVSKWKRKPFCLNTGTLELVDGNLTYFWWSFCSIEEDKTRIRKKTLGTGSTSRNIWMIFISDRRMQYIFIAQIFFLFISPYKTLFPQYITSCPLLHSQLQEPLIRAKFISIAGQEELKIASVTGEQWQQVTSRNREQRSSEQM